MNYFEKLKEQADKYYREASDYTVILDPPSKLLRGSGTPYSGTLMYVDLESSTDIMSERSLPTYLKFSHVYLSLLNEIVVDFGARKEWVEYVGDGIIAHFVDGDSSEDTWNAIFAGMQIQALVDLIIPNLSQSFKTMGFTVKVAIHYDKFLVAKIGPWGDATVKPIGSPIHVVSKLQEKTVGGDILLSKYAVDQLDFSDTLGRSIDLPRNKHFKNFIFERKLTLIIGKKPYLTYKFNVKKLEILLSKFR